MQRLPLEIFTFLSCVIQYCMILSLVLEFIIVFLGCGLHMTSHVFEVQWCYSDVEKETMIEQRRWSSAFGICSWSSVMWCKMFRETTLIILFTFSTQVKWKQFLKNFLELFSQVLMYLWSLNFLILLSLDITETIIILPSSYFWNLDKLVITQVPLTKC